MNEGYYFKLLNIYYLLDVFSLGGSIILKIFKIAAITFLCALLLSVVYFTVKQVFNYAQQSETVSEESIENTVKKSLKLLNASVEVINDKDRLGAIEITEGEKKGEELVPTALYYEFTIKNTSKKSVGTYNKQGLEVNIIPNDHLVSVTNKLIGFNIFDPSEYSNSGVGYGKSFDSVLKPGQAGLYILHYDLGVNEENAQVPLLVPSAEKLQSIKSNALDATLVVTLDHKEILRFDLRDFK